MRKIIVKPKIDQENKIEDSLRNIIMFSFSFMLIITALWTTLNIEQTILKSKEKDEPDFSGDGYISLGIIYSVMAIANFASPSLLAILHAKQTLIICSIFYVIFIVNLMFVTTWSLYLVSGIVGLTAAGLWTAQGNYLTLNSTNETITRNTGIFWIFHCCSYFIGNGVVFWNFFGKTHIDVETRDRVLTILSCIGICGVVCFLFLNDTRPKINDETVPKSLGPCGPVSAFLNSIKLLKERNMQLLVVSFLYIGANQSFFAAIYPTSIGFTKQLGSISKSLVGLSGICVGTGGLIGGGFVMLFASKLTAKHGRFGIVLTGCGLLSTAYILTFLNIPHVANLGATDDVAYWNPPSPVIAMISSFCLGFGDSLVHTQIYGTLSTLWQPKSSQAFAILHLYKSSAIAFQFFNSTRVGLTAQLIMLQLICILSCVAFYIVDRNIKNLIKVEVEETEDYSTSV